MKRTVCMLKLMADILSWCASGAQAALFGFLVIDRTSANNRPKWVAWAYRNLGLSCRIDLRPFSFHTRQPAWGLVFAGLGV